MTSTKLIVAYPQPTNIDAFENVYTQEHVPMAIANLEGKTKVVATRILQSPRGNLSFTVWPRSIFLRWRHSSVVPSLLAVKRR
jgi:hypothetical protein